MDGIMNILLRAGLAAVLVYIVMRLVRAIEEKKKK